MSEPLQRTELYAIRLALLLLPIALIVLAAVFTSEKSARVMGIGLALEAGGASAIFARAFVEERGFWLIRREADEKTIVPFYIGGLGLVCGFILQFISVVLM